VPIRVRLTLWYGLLLGCTLLLFCLALYFSLHTALERDFDEILRVRARQVERDLADRSGAGDAELTSGEIALDDLEPAALEEFAESDVYVQVLSPRGGILATSGTSLPANPELIAEAAARDGAFDTLAIGQGQQLRTLYWPVRVDGRMIAVVQVAETLELIEQTMRDARNLMLGGALVLLAAALGSGWLITRRALQPVATVTEAARYIAETGRFERRLTPAKPRDELSALAATFDLMIARLERIVTQQREFVADTSHELRNPLSVIRGNLDFVRRVTADQSCLESIHEAEVEAARMGRLIEDLLLLAQADVGEFLALRPLRLDTILREVGERALAIADGQRIELGPTAETWVQGDSDRLRQVFWNLVENALRYTPSGGQIGLRLWDDGRDATVEVADAGPGVPPGHEARIFERFYRADSSRARATGGAGLGLAIVKYIVEAHGGRVWLANHPGAGATFAVSLPLARTRPACEQGAGQAPAEDGADASRARRRGDRARPLG
jgi:signal transduction histidine kinase